MEISPKGTWELPSLTVWAIRLAADFHSISRTSPGVNAWMNFAEAG
jgi:hypothetical protein